MTLIKIKKILAVGPKTAQALFFNRAQQEGIIEFINSDVKQPSDLSAEVQAITYALKVLRRLPVTKQIEPKDEGQARAITTEILQAQQRLQHLQEEGRLLFQEKVRVEAFGEFDPVALQELESQGRAQIQFFHSKQGSLLDFEQKPNLIYIATENGMDYFISFNPTKRAYEGLIEMQVPLSMRQVKEKIQAVDLEIHDIESRLKMLNRYNTFLHHALVIALDRHHLAEANGFVVLELDETLFAVEGWIPENQIDHLKKAVGSMPIYLEEIGVDEVERIPTHFENKGLARVGEDLVRIYDTPAITDRDPSLWVLWSFALFFAIIIADAGYGLIFFLTTLYFYIKKRPQKLAGKRLIKLAFIIFASCIVWGSITASFFGLELKPSNPLRRISFIEYLATKDLAWHKAADDAEWKSIQKDYPQAATLQNDKDVLMNATATVEGKTVRPVLEKFKGNILFELALLIGTIHVILSLLRYSNRNWAAIGWVIFLVGAYLYFPQMLQTVSILNFAVGIPATFAQTIGFDLIWVGIGLAVVLALIQKKWGGLMEVMLVIQIFGDVLSYLRLYALGLAGAMVAATFNEMGRSVGVIFGPLIIIAGHLINIVMGLMSGVIHGLRLNFLEWYHYSFEGGGRLFNPLKLLQKQK